jgi:hypothetical protein
MRGKTMTEVITLADRLATVAKIVEFLTTNALGTTPASVVDALQDVRVRDGVLHQIATSAFTIEGFVTEGHELECDTPEADHTKMNACMLLQEATQNWEYERQVDCAWMWGMLSAIALLDGEETIAQAYAINANGENSLAKLILTAVTHMPEGKASEIFMQSIKAVGDLETTVKGAS